MMVVMVVVYLEIKYGQVGGAGMGFEARICLSILQQSSCKRSLGQ